MLYYEVVMKLAYKAMKEEGKTFLPFKELLRLGSDTLAEYCREGKLNRGLVAIPGKGLKANYTLTDSVEEVEFNEGILFQKFPRKIDKRGKGYYSLVPNEDGTAKYKWNSLLCDQYVFEETCEVTTDVIEKQNRIKFGIWKPILSFDRENDNTSDSIYQDESALLKRAVSELWDDHIYVGHFFDKRGRLYQDSWLLNYQGDEWNKASLVPYLGKQRLTTAGLNAVKIHLSNQFGLDKQSYSDRIAAVDNGDCSDINVAKKPILATKGLEMLQNAVVGQEFKGSVTIDATNSGFQIYSLLTGDSEVATATNLVDTSVCRDLYGEVCDKILSDSKTSNPLGLIVSDIREEIKKAIMGVGYNSDKLPIEKLNEIVAKGVVPNYASYKKFINVSEHITNLKEVLNKLLVDTFSYKDPSDCVVKWRMPDGFLVEIPLTVKDKAYIETTVNKGQIPLERRYWTFDKLGWSRKDNWRSLVPNIVHSIDAYVCREVIRRCSFKVMTIHDSFTCHPNNVGMLRKIYLTILDEINQSNMVEYIGKQINPSFSYTKTGDGFKVAISEDSYALC